MKRFYLKNIDHKILDKHFSIYYQRSGFKRFDYRSEIVLTNKKFNEIRTTLNKNLPSELQPTEEQLYYIPFIVNMVEICSFAVYFDLLDYKSNFLSLKENNVGYLKDLYRVHNKRRKELIELQAYVKDDKFIESWRAKQFAKNGKGIPEEFHTGLNYMLNEMIEIWLNQNPAKPADPAMEHLILISKCLCSFVNDVFKIPFTKEGNVSSHQCLVIGVILGNSGVIENKNEYEHFGLRERQALIPNELRPHEKERKMIKLPYKDYIRDRIKPWKIHQNIQNEYLV